MSREIIAPDSVDAFADVITDAAKTKTRFEILGGGTRQLGHKVEAEKTLSTANLRGITLYEPKELVISALAGTPVEEIEKTLNDNDQMLAFEPMDHRALSGATGVPTIGGVAAANISGPRRLSAGAARDHIIGIKLINGRGEQIKSGGRVMKNVTGLDLVKLMCGAHGTLGLLTEVTLKVLPRPPLTQSLSIAGFSETDALAMMAKIMATPYDISGAAFIPAQGETRSKLLLRFEGSENSVTYRVRQIADLQSPYNPMTIVVGLDNKTVWEEVRSCPIHATPDSNLWRVSIATSKALAFAQALDDQGTYQRSYDLAGGLIWIVTPDEDLTAATTLRELASSYGGHATLVRANDAYKAQSLVFQPVSDTVLSLTRGVKHSFDPHGIFNFGRMYRGI